jgi:hypothetical protein
MRVNVVLSGELDPTTPAAALSASSRGPRRTRQVPGASVSAISAMMAGSSIVAGRT